MKLNLLRNWQILLLILCVVGSIVLILPVQQKGVVVVSVSPNSPLYGKIQEGETIDWANEKTIQTPEDFYAFDNFTGVLRFMHNGKLELANIPAPGLGITVEKPPGTRLSLGMDLIGGTRVLLKPKENVSSDIMQQIIATLQTRINIYGLREASFQSVEDVTGNKYAQIEMAGGSKEEIENLLAKQGKFEAKIPTLVTLENNKGSLLLGDKNYAVELDDKIKIDNEEVGLNESFVLDGIGFKLLNITNDTVVLVSTVFSGADVRSVCMQEQAGICVSRMLQQKEGWQFMFQVFISEEAAEKFAKVTKNMKVIVDPRTGEAYLDGRIAFFLDEKLITELNIAADLAGKAYTQPMITGFRQEKEEARQEKLMLQSILQSGALPVSLETIRIDQISATLGQEFIKTALIAGLIAAAAVSCIIFIRYRKIQIVIPAILTSMSEVIMILGAACLIHWTIDLAAIAGIIAAVGTGVDSQIMILDELRLERKVYTLKQKIKRAFFIIFGAGSTTIAAMLPLMFIGIGIMRGFAITTILGVLIGIFISRPAFGKIAEIVMSRAELKQPVQ